MMKINNGRFGFILQDSGEPDMFVMPVQCQAFGGMLPPVGTRLAYLTVLDPKNGKPRAEQVEPLENFQVAAPAEAAAEALDPLLEMEYQSFRKDLESVNTVEAKPVPGGGLAAAEVGGMLSGTVKQTSGKFGFIMQDNGEADMFFMPMQCRSFGGICPPVGTRVRYSVLHDPKTGKPRAEDVQAEDPLEAALAQDQLAQAHQPGVQASGMGQVDIAPSPDEFVAGVVKVNNGRFGFILQDSAEEDMFVMPAQCQDFGGEIPPVGTRVVYTFSVDRKTGRHRAENVTLEEGFTGTTIWGGGAPPRDSFRAGCHSQEAQPMSGQPGPGPGHSMESAGAVKQNSGRYGFILQDSGEPDMFLMPVQCQAFGGEIPPVGTRVVYKAVVDPKNGKLRAEDVQPEAGPARQHGDSGRKGGYPWAGGELAGDELTGSCRPGLQEEGQWSFQGGKGIAHRKGSFGRAGPYARYVS